jgi:hypothetical protein
MQEIKQKLIVAAVVGIVVGIGVGGLIWGSAPEKVEVEKLVQSSITVVETRDVVVEKRITVKEIVTAERAQVIETQQPDGTVVIDSRYYGLGVSKESTAAETTTLHEASSTAAAYTASEKTTVTSRPKWVVAGGFFISPVDPLSFDYRKDWQVTVGRRVGESPFFIKGLGGPKLLGLAIAFEF